MTREELQAAAHALVQKHIDTLQAQSLWRSTPPMRQSAALWCSVLYAIAKRGPNVPSELLIAVAKAAVAFGPLGAAMAAEIAQDSPPPHLTLVKENNNE